MRKNRSFKENSFARSRGSRGKEVSIELDSKATPAPSSRYDESSRTGTDRLNASNWHHNPSLSQNILKEIINYSNIAHSSTRRATPSTLAVFDKSGDNVLSQLAKINKKTGEGNSRKEAKRLTLDFVESKEAKEDRGCTMEEKDGLLQMSKSLALVESVPIGSPGSFSGCKSSSLYYISEEERARLEMEKSQSAAYLEQLTILEESMQNEHSEMIPFWERMIHCDAAIATLQTRAQQLDQSICAHKARLETLNTALLTTNKQFLLSRQEWQAKGWGARSQLVQQAQGAQEEFLRRLTVRDFSETVLFNMKVAIPEYKGKSTLRGIYEELFRSRSAKKFTMILKKHSAHMDLYDGRLLNDFTKRINDLEALFLRADADARHPDQHFVEMMAQLVGEVEAERGEVGREEGELQEARRGLQAAREEQRVCEQGIHQVIDEMNSQVRGEYSRETEREADFKTLLLGKTISKYREFRSIRERKAKAAAELQAVQERLLGPHPL